MGGQNSKVIIAVAVSLGLGLVGLLFYQSFWVPYRDLQEQRDKAERDLAAKNKEIREFDAKKKKLDQARQASFPVNVKWLSEYQTYLRQLARNLKDPSPGADKTGADKGPHIIAPATTADTKPQTGKKADQITRVWIVKAKATWPAVVAFLEDFQRTPLLHRMKAIHIERPSDATTSADKKEKKPFVDELNVTFTIETLSMKNDKRTDSTIWTKDGKVVTAEAYAALGMTELAPGRKYEVLAKYYNPFRGGLTPEEKKKAGWDLDFEEGEKKETTTPDAKETKPPDSLITKDMTDVRQFVRLTMNVESTKEIRVNVNPEGTPGTSSGGFRPIALKGDDPVALARDKSKSVDYYVDLQAKPGDPPYRVDGVSPAGMGLSAEITAKGNLKITVSKDANVGSFDVKLKTKRATLFNRLVGPTDPRIYTSLSTRFPFDTFGIKTEDSSIELTKGTVLHIGHEGVYFTARDPKSTDPKKIEMYRIGNGETVYDALRKPLKSADLQELDWWALSPLAASTVGIFGAPGPGALLSSFSLYPGRPGLRNPVEQNEALETVGKADRIGE